MTVETLINQIDYWEQEHAQPSEITQISDQNLSFGVRLFLNWLRQHNITFHKGLEMCCGQGRNILGLAKLGIEIQGFDFSQTAIVKAYKEIQQSVVYNAHIWHHNAYDKWIYNDGRFDFVIDCFATTDLEDAEGRAFAASEAGRVLKPGGFLLAYTLSSDDAWSQYHLAQSPLPERNSYITPKDKFEKCFDRDELITLYSSLQLIEARRIEKTPAYNGIVYPAQHHWMIFQKGTQNT